LAPKDDIGDNKRHADTPHADTLRRHAWVAPRNGGLVSFTIDCRSG
jgi:hypothetical protein